MATSFTLTYKEQIEELKEYKDFETRGDELYMHHEDDEARLEWAFYRPSGSHPDQVSDKNAIVSIMAFNHSRLGALERFKRLHEDVKNKDNLRIKVRNRSRMLFRAMVDDDFKELVEVLQLYPVFLDLAYDQVINGRIWNDTFADPHAASVFLNMFDEVDKNLVKGIHRRLQPVKNFGVDGANEYLGLLTDQAQNLHNVVKEYFVKEYEKWIKKTSLHPLQVIIWQKKIDILKD